MNRIISLNSFNANSLQALRAGALLVQEVVKEQFCHVNEANILDSKKISIVATEELTFAGKSYFCIISTLCEALDFKGLEGKSVYDYNQERSLILTSKVATENIPVLRVALNEEKNKILLLCDNMKFDFFSYSETNIKSGTLLFQLISDKNLISKLSKNKLKQIEELINFREFSPENSFFKVWRQEFIDKQCQHLKAMQFYVDDIDLLVHYKELLALELGESSI